MTDVTFRQALRSTLAAAALVVALPPSPNATAQEAALEAQFKDPPTSARPRVWWHWMNGNITEDGIAKDMAWMKRAGIGGLQNFDAALTTPPIVPNRLAFMTPDWKKAFRFAAAEADRNGLELAIAASPGWSETGGPWVDAKDGMKKLVWSETVVSGGQPFSGRLPAPPNTTGPFQRMDFDPGIAAAMGGKPFVPPSYYEDVAVLAVPIPAGDETATPTFTDGQGKSLDAAALTDGDPKTTVQLPSEGAAIVVQYPSPQTIRSATLFMPGGAVMFFGSRFAPRLEASDDGRTWRRVSDVPASEVPSTVSFTPVTAARFRVVFPPNTDNPPSPIGGTPGVDDTFFAMMTRTPPTVAIGDLRLSGEARINQAEAKAAFRVANDYYSLDADAGPDTAGVAPGSVVDLTGKLQPDGRLDWTPPAGRFRVIRFGASLTGKSNHPATPEATGLEVDKFDGGAVRRYLETYLDMYKGATGPELFGKRGVRVLLTDSIEVGASNWTPQLRAQFKRLRGYDPLPWLPALTGVIVGSRSESDRFLFDFRRTLADLIASEHYGTVAKVARERGLMVYGEALEGGRPSLGDDMAMRSYTDIPMAALWTYRPDAGPNVVSYADMKGAASVAHLYGQGLVAAESMTSGMAPWAHAPVDLRRVIDLEFAYGINRPVIHTSVHQPVDDKQPGLSLMIFGQFFNRHETWAEMARPWIDYISRNSLMLQQGRYFADVAYFYGEEGPLTGLYLSKPVSDAPVRYGYDFINTDALLNLVSVTGGDLTAKSGARYRVLYLGGSSRRMSLPVLRRVAALAEAGRDGRGPGPRRLAGARGRRDRIRRAGTAALGRRADHDGGEGARDRRRGRDRARCDRRRSGLPHHRRPGQRDPLPAPSALRRRRVLPEQPQGSHGEGGRPLPGQRQGARDLAGRHRDERGRLVPQRGRRHDRSPRDRARGLVLRRLPEAGPGDFEDRRSADVEGDGNAQRPVVGGLPVRPGCAGLDHRARRRSRSARARTAASSISRASPRGPRPSTLRRSGRRVRPCGSTWAEWATWPRCASTACWSVPRGRRPGPSTSVPPRRAGATRSRFAWPTCGSTVWSAISSRVRRRWLSSPSRPTRWTLPCGPRV